MRMNAVNVIALILVIIGAINWGLIGLFQFDLVALLFGVMSMLSRIIYVLVGLAGVYLIFAAAMGRSDTVHARNTTTTRSTTMPPR